MQLLLVFTLLICSSHPWELKTSHKQVTHGITKDVTLECRYDNQDNGQPRLGIVSGIQIHKLHGSKKRDTYAKIYAGRDNRKAVVGKGVGTGVIAAGLVDDIKSSYLSITWSVSSSTTTGQFSCEIDGYTEGDESLGVVTNSISIVESQLSLQYLLTMILDVKKMTENNREKSSKTISSFQELTKRVNEDLDKLNKDINITQEMIHDVPKMRNKIAKKEVSLIVDSKLQDNWYEKRKWPGGQYALLNPEDGCPSSTTSVWTSGYIKFHTESTQVGTIDAVSQPNHLAKPVFEKNMTNNFVYIRTCKRQIDASGPAWPKGSYCIHRVGGHCPVGFEEAKVELDPEDNPRTKSDFNNAPDFLLEPPLEYATLFFCCRNDADPTTAMILPVDTPFYLYRYKGKCQSVQGVKTSDEWLQIVTEKNANRDRYLTTAFPDSTLNPLRLFLCYYSK